MRPDIGRPCAGPRAERSQLSAGLEKLPVQRAQEPGRARRGTAEGEDVEGAVGALASCRRGVRVGVGMQVELFSVAG